MPHPCVPRCCVSSTGQARGPLPTEGTLEDEPRDQHCLAASVQHAGVRQRSLSREMDVLPTDAAGSSTTKFGQCHRTTKHRPPGHQSEGRNGEPQGHCDQGPVRGRRGPAVCGVRWVFRWRTGPWSAGRPGQPLGNGSRWRQPARPGPELPRHTAPQSQAGTRAGVGRRAT